MIVVFQLSTFIYFVVPMIVITLFYILIGVKLRRNELLANGSPQYGKATATRARRAILKMLGKYTDIDQYTELSYIHMARVVM